jgi:hypothetical protein
MIFYMISFASTQVFNVAGSLGAFIASLYALSLPSFSFAAVAKVLLCEFCSGPIVLKLRQVGVVVTSLWNIQ